MDDKLSTHEAGTRQSSSYYRTSIQHTRYERSVNLATTSSHLIFKDRTSKPVSSFPIQPLSPNDLPTWSSIGDRNKHRVPSQDAVISRNVKTPPAAVSTTQTSIEIISNPIPKSTLNGDLNKHRLPSQSIFEREFGSKLTTPPAQQKFLEYKASMPKETVSQLLVNMVTHYLKIIPLIVIIIYRNNGTRYDLKKPGYVLIFNQEKFNDKNLFREGTMKDEKDLINLFKKFNVEKFISNHDLSLSQIESRIHKGKDYFILILSISVYSLFCIVRRKDFRKYSCLIVTIMTHGCQNDVLLAKDEQYNFKDTILEPLLQNTTLSGKPKIFIIQVSTFFK